MKEKTADNTHEIKCSMESILWYWTILLTKSTDNMGNMGTVTAVNSTRFDQIHFC